MEFADRKTRLAHAPDGVGASIARTPDLKRKGRTMLKSSLEAATSAAGTVIAMRGQGKAQMA